jgi:hypothetical protein
LQVFQRRHKPALSSALQAELLENAQTIRVKVLEMDPCALLGQTAQPHGRQPGIVAGAKQDQPPAQAGQAKGIPA